MKCVLDGIEVFPATTRVLDMVPDDPSTWLYPCHVNEHIDNGMEMLFLRSHMQILLAHYWLTARHLLTIIIVLANKNVLCY
jgi:hypothetical protein